MHNCFICNKILTPLNDSGFSSTLCCKIESVLLNDNPVYFKYEIKDHLILISGKITILDGKGNIVFELNGFKIPTDVLQFNQFIDFVGKVIIFS